MTRAEQAACKYAGLKTPPTDDTGLLTTTSYYTFLEGYQEAEQDHSLTAEDVKAIFNKVRDEQFKYCATEGYYQEVADWFNEKRKENEGK